MPDKKELEFYKNSINLAKIKLELLLDKVEYQRHSIKIYQENIDSLHTIILEQEIRDKILGKL